MDYGHFGNLGKFSHMMPISSWLHTPKASRTTYWTSRGRSAIRTSTVTLLTKTYLCSNAWIHTGFIGQILHTGLSCLTYWNAFINLFTYIFMNVFCYDGLGIVSNNAADPDPHHFPFLLVLYVKIIKIDINQNSIFRIKFF